MPGTNLSPRYLAANKVPGAWSVHLTGGETDDSHIHLHRGRGGSDGKAVTRRMNGKRQGDTSDCQ